MGRCSLNNQSAVLMMARIAALSGAGSFAQAVTTWDSSGLNGTEICAPICALPFGFPNESDSFRRFKSCRGHHFSVFDPARHRVSDSEFSL